MHIKKGSFTMKGGVIEGCDRAIELLGSTTDYAIMYAHGSRVYGLVNSGQYGLITRRDSTVTTSIAFYGEVINTHDDAMMSGEGKIDWGTFYGKVEDYGEEVDTFSYPFSYRYFNGYISGGTFYGPVIVDVDGESGLRITGGPLWKGRTLIWCHRDGTPYSFGTPLTGSLTLYGGEENGTIFISSDGVSLWYEGGNTFGSSRAATPTSVEIDGEPVAFSGSGSRFTVRRLPRNARWITARWNSTSVTVSFTPDADAYIAEVAIPKTGDASIAAYGLLALLAAAGVLRKK